MATLAPGFRMAPVCNPAGPAGWGELRSDVHWRNDVECCPAQAVQTAAHGMRANLDHSQ